MKPRLRLGVVGCGDIGAILALLAVLNPKIRLSACCDVDVGRLERLARRLRVPARYSDFRQLLGQADLDAVYLAVPHHLHYEMIQAALSAGKPVLTEKPITRTLVEGSAVVRLAEERRIPLGVNYQYRYDAGCHRLARSVQAGVLGRLLHARINVPWSRSQAYFDQSPWHQSLAASGGGTLITQASHFLDIVLWAWGSRPIAAQGIAVQRRFRGVQVEDTALGAVMLEDGGLVQVSSSMAVARERAVTIEIYGEKGTGVYSNRPWPHARFFGVHSASFRPPHFGLHALQRSLEGFRAWVVEGRPYLIPGREALPVLAAVDALYRSAQSGKTEPVCSPE